MAGKGGKRERAGRPKGVPNKITGDLKEIILQALAEADENGLGAKQYLIERARENPVAFLALLGRILPLQVAGDPDKPIGHVHEIKIRIVDPKG